MKTERLKRILRDVKRGDIEISKALTHLKDLPYEETGFASIDHHRSLRQGIPEVIYCQGKRTAHIIEIVKRMRRVRSDILATRVEPQVFEAIRRVDPRASYNEIARTVTLVRKDRVRRGHILLITAGTSDLPVAEEAKVTAEVLGSRVSTLFDVGVAGVHRILNKREMLRQARVLIVVAGMDGVLASVVGGLTERPVIAVPTSVGYGASFRGLAALLTMLNSCAPGVAVVNIDNGFGAGCLAHKINRLGKR